MSGDRRAPLRRLAGGPGRATPSPIGADAAVAKRFVKVVHRPGAVQTEIRIGHPGLPRQIEDFHAVSVMAAILGGLFNSRLNMKLREEKGYTYGAGAGFDLRRAARAVRRAGRREHRGHRSRGHGPPGRARADPRRDRVTDAELRRPATSSSACSRCGSRRRARSSGRSPGSFVHELPDDELASYRPAIEAVSIDDVLAARAGPPRTSIRPRSSSSATRTRSASQIEAAGFGRVEVERDEGPVMEGPIEGVHAELGPVNSEETGPAAGAAEPPDDSTDAGGEGRNEPGSGD